MKAIIRFRGLFNFLSNFYKSPICYQDNMYPTAEHLFQALKTRDDMLRQTICEIKGPYEARRLGRQIKLRNDWEEVKDKAMLLVIKLKFLQNPKLTKRLLFTNKRPLIEGNYHHDNYWGSCTCPKCRYITPRNQLGKILMTVRKILRED